LAERVLEEQVTVEPEPFAGTGDGGKSAADDAAKPASASVAVEGPAPEFRSIRDVRAEIVPPLGDLPTDPGHDVVNQQPMRLHQLGAVRGYPEMVCVWTPPAVKHHPLYFQEIALERYGYHYGAAQSFISSAVFLRNVTLLPIRVLAECPGSLQYTLGYERPGNCAPVNCYRPQLLPMPTGDGCDEPEDEVIPAYKVCR